MDAYESMVRRLVRLGLEDNTADFLDVLSECDGADPRLVRLVYDDEVARAAPRTVANGAAIRGQTESALAAWRLPAPDPGRAQWWFTTGTLESLAKIVVSLLDGERTDARVMCLGAPTVAPRIAALSVQTTVADNDPDVLWVVRDVTGSTVTTIEYDVADDLPDDLHGRFDAVVADPPWYYDDLKLFVVRALRALKVGGKLLLSLPPTLTRPEAREERAEFLDWLAARNVTVEALETRALRYLVPRFEEAALRSVDGFSGRPWRSGDLLRVRTTASGAVDESGVRRVSRRAVTSFARSPAEFRVFLGSQASAPPRTTICAVEGYAENVSRRAHKVEPDVWTTEKSGARVENLEEARQILASWAEGKTKREAADSLASTNGIALETAEHVVTAYEDVLGLWSRYAQGTPRRTPQEIAEARNAQLSSWAMRPSENVDADGFRIGFQRDRDRVLWSSSLRKLANKTQLFPVERDDELRQRLTHSIEVMQLALTLAASFGLNEDLVQAGALAHDIGHTPFGHAGEHALDRLLLRINPELPGFNHYEHGVDVVRWLEGPYQSPDSGGFAGLRLTSEVAECIFKHTFCQAGPGASHDELRRVSKHRDLPDGYCHLEGQAVRLADKVSYLISDLEDGARLGVVTEAELLRCRLFHRPPIDLRHASAFGLFETIVRQRKNIIKVLMEDAILETGRRLARHGSAADVRKAGDYTVDHSPELKADLDEIWVVVQAGRLHKHPSVVAANMRAARVVSELTLLFAAFPQFIEPQFRQAHERLHATKYIEHYTRRVGPSVQILPALLRFLPVDLLIGEDYEPGKPSTIPTPDVIMATDFVAGLTDTRARELHARHIESNSPWR